MPLKWNLIYFVILFAVLQILLTPPEHSYKADVVVRATELRPKTLKPCFTEHERCEAVRLVVMRLLNKQHLESRIGPIEFADAFMCVVVAIRGTAGEDKELTRHYFHPGKTEAQRPARLDFIPRFDLHVAWMSETFARVKWKPPVGSMEVVTGQAVYLYNGDDACVLPRDIYEELDRMGVKAMFMNGLVDDDRHVLVPDTDFISTKGHKETRAKMHTRMRQIDWDEKKPTAVFRGSSTGGNPTPGRLYEIPRLRLGAMMQLPEFEGMLLDAGVTQIVQSTDKWATEMEARKLGMLQNPISDDLMAANYKIVLDVDGNANSWSGSYWKLASGSLTLKVMCEYRQWWYNLIEPWVHYVPVKCDMSDLAEMIKWSLNSANAAMVKTIIMNSTRLMETITWDRYLDEFAERFSKDIYECEII